MGSDSLKPRYGGVRLTHLPTGIMAECSEHRTIDENRVAALKLLRARVYAYLHPEDFPSMGRRTWKPGVLEQDGSKF